VQNGGTAEGVSWIEDIRDYRAIAAMVGLPYLLGIEAEALHVADRTVEALEAVGEAKTLVARSGERRWCAELHRLRGVFLADMGAEESQIEASFQEAIRTAKDQKSVSLWRASRSAG
jgi:predicted ATPase